MQKREAAAAEIKKVIGTAFVYPVVIWTARRYRAWDPLHDATFVLIGGAFGALALWLNRDALAMLAAAGN